MSLAYFYRCRTGRLAVSGYAGQGDPGGIPLRAKAAAAVPYSLAAVVDVGRPFLVTEQGDVYLIGGPEKARFTTWPPDSLVNAARLGWFGFRLLLEDRGGGRFAGRARTPVHPGG